MNKNPLKYINDIIESIGWIQEYTKETNKEDFLKSVPNQDMVSYRLMLIGEVTKNLPTSLRKTYSDVPWKKMAGLRDILIHQYDGIDFESVWKVSVKDIILLKKQMLKIKANLEQGQI